MDNENGRPTRNRKVTQPFDGAESPKTNVPKRRATSGLKKSANLRPKHAPKKSSKSNGSKVSAEKEIEPAASGTQF